MKRLAWITGGGSGIGRSLAMALAAAGWQVVISGRNAQRLAELCSDSIAALPLDVTDRRAVNAAVAQIEAEHGAIELAVLCAGDYQPMSLTEFDAGLFERLIQVNFLGAVKCVAALLGPMRARAAGQILLVGSLSAYRGLPLAAPYGASKAALLSMAESLHPECAAAGIRLRVASPGFVRSQLTARNQFSMPQLLQPEQAADAIMRQLEGRRFEFSFPWRLATWLRLLRLLPYRWYFGLMRRVMA